MFRVFLLTFLLISFAGCNFSESNEETPIRKKLPKDILFMQRAFPLDHIKQGAYEEAKLWRNQKISNKNLNPSWEFSGPENIGGRITDIEVAPDNQDTYYVGAASGGIFKTTDAGDNWIPIFDDQPFLSIGDIELSQNNPELVWAGTGEPNAGGGSLAYDGDGVYKSTDGGLSWENKGLNEVGSIGKVKMDPNNDNRVYVAAMGALFRKDTNRGVYRTTNGGEDWEQVLFVSDSTGVIDMTIHPTNGDIVYATSWERTRRPNDRQYGGETSRIYKTTDGGDNWTILTNGLPVSPSQKGRISIDISKSNPNVLYAMYADAVGNVQGVYKTINGGDSWTAVNSNQLINVGFHWWFEGIFVDPSDEDIIYYLGLNVQKSTNGGTSWFNSFSNVHVDQHALAFNPSLPGQVLLGNDGGFYKSNNDGVSSVKDLTLPITQFYRFHVDFQNPNKIYGGAQDNSTMRTTTGGLNDWAIITGGDGFQPLVDPTNTNVIYALSQYGNLMKSVNNGTSFSGVTSGISGADRKNWDTPIALDPADSQTLYYGANRLYKSVNAAVSWTSISPDLSNGPHQGNLVYGTIISISVSPLDSQKIVVGTDDGNVWITQNGGTEWTKVSDDLPNRWVTKVLTDREDVDSFYVTFSGYRYGENNGHVYKTSDNGATWTNISGDLPDMPVNSIAKDIYGNLFLATDIGVLASADEGVNWDILGDNLPSVVVTDIHLHEPTETLYAATYGRSSYKMNISGDILRVQSQNQDFNVKLFPNPTKDNLNIKLDNRFQNIKIFIVDNLGRTVKTKNFKNIQSISLDMSALSKATYLIKIVADQNEITKKVIVY
ncbi:T9SS type A sorting domain-containing protein [Planktosalinus lacus]|uniref:Glycosyl hydrolase n=1 Tax=Planktosalinus lacus TaxID=1526573 RepID=A0A8J2V8W3_9FLAO|nr:T9SS type A sorting domain-containing protein [Planktosalinus lacus]GGD86958.1 hypothetical protein GCM10011312_08770 [Planktosalinus lacus]